MSDPRFVFEDYPTIQAFLRTRGIRPSTLDSKSGLTADEENRYIQACLSTREYDGVPFGPLLMAITLYLDEGGLQYDEYKARFMRLIDIPDTVLDSDMKGIACKILNLQRPEREQIKVKKSTSKRTGIGCLSIILSLIIIIIVMAGSASHGIH